MNNPAADYRTKTALDNQSYFLQVAEMIPYKPLSASEQLAAYLRENIMVGTWGNIMPGSDRLVKELGVGRGVIFEALAQLESEGLLVTQGAGKRRLIKKPEIGKEGRKLRVGMFLWGPSDRAQKFILDIQHSLAKAGYIVVLASKTLTDINMDPQRVAREVEKADADVWIASSAARPVLEWFVERNIPVFAIFGSCMNLPVAGFRLKDDSGLSQAREFLFTLGHRRIVMLLRRQHRAANPSHSVQNYSSWLMAKGISPTSFHLPDWDDTSKGFHQCLESLFRVTPHTAIMVDEGPQFVTTCLFLAQRGLRIPGDVSVVCLEPDAFTSLEPGLIAQIEVDYSQIPKYVLRWVSHINHGKPYVKQHLAQSKYLNGSTVGVAVGS
jgi:DNA-binding LacI/PurR family transcriptional regulator